MATIEDVLEAVGRLGEQVAVLEVGQRELRAEQQALRAALDDQGRELRHHMDRVLTREAGGRREHVEDRFKSLDTELAIVTRMVARLDRDAGVDQSDIRLELLRGLQSLRQRVDVLEKRLGDGPPPSPGGPATPPPPAR